MNKNFNLIDGHNNLINVIEDTLEILSNEEYIENGNIHSLKKGMDMMGEGSFKTDKIEKLSPENCPGFNTTITVENLDTFEKAGQKGWREEAICLNMASEFVPGGGVLRGAKAQEEDLCRRSTLLPSLYAFENLYPISTYGAIYSPMVEVFKDKDYDLMSQPFYTNVISAAAIRNPKLNPDGRMSKDDKNEAANKIRSILRLAGKMGKTKLILGAWGCGAFNNPPKDIATLFKKIINSEEFTGWFSDICFAILDNPLRKETNYKIFKSILDE